MSLPNSIDNTMTGGCPICGREDGFVNDGREHWFFCRTHRLTWHGGSNLFSQWREETAEQADQRRVLIGYRDATEELAKRNDARDSWRAIQARRDAVTDLEWLYGLKGPACRLIGRGPL